MYFFRGSRSGLLYLILITPRSRSLAQPRPADGLRVPLFAPANIPSSSHPDHSTKSLHHLPKPTPLWSLIYLFRQPLIMSWIARRSHHSLGKWILLRYCIIKEVICCIDFGFTSRIFDTVFEKALKVSFCRSKTVDGPEADDPCVVRCEVLGERSMDVLMHLPAENLLKEALELEE